MTAWDPSCTVFTEHPLWGVGSLASNMLWGGQEVKGLIRALGPPLAIRRWVVFFLDWMRSRGRREGWRTPGVISSIQCWVHTPWTQNVAWELCHSGVTVKTACKKSLCVFRGLSHEEGKAKETHSDGLQPCDPGKGVLSPSWGRGAYTSLSVVWRLCSYVRQVCSLVLLMDGIPFFGSSHHFVSIPFFSLTDLPHREFSRLRSIFLNVDLVYHNKADV